MEQIKVYFVPSTSWTRSKCDSNEVKMANTIYGV